MPVTMTAVTHSRATAADGTVTCSFSSSTPRRCPTPPDPSLKRYRALAVGMIREAREMDSRQLGYLVAGEEIAALATETVGDHLRVQFRRGWASVFWQGKQMLELLPDAQQRSASPAPADDSGSDEEEEKEPVREEELARRQGWVAAVPLFRGLDSTRALAIARALTPRKVAKRAVVIEKGNVGEQEMYFVAQGSLEVLLQSLDEPPIAKLGVGKFFGESSLLDNAPRNAYVRARKAVLLYVLRKADLKAILRDTEAQVREATEKQRAEWEERNHAAETLLRAVDSESESDDSDDEP